MDELSKGAPNALRNSKWYSINLNLEILTDCENNCSGCFIDKKLSFIEKDLLKLATLTTRWKDNEYDLNELFLGPTDIFSASNFDHIINNSNFKYISRYFVFTCITACLNDKDEIKRRLELMENCENWNAGNYEVYVILDVQKYLSHDEEYLTILNQNLELLDKDKVFFVLNVYGEEMFDELDLANITKKVKDDYNTTVRVHTSFFRKNNDKYARLYKEMLEHSVSDDNIQDIYLNMADIYSGGFVWANYTFSNHELYVTPFIYEAIPILSDAFKIPITTNGEYDLLSMDHKEIEMIKKQYDFTSQTLECDSCKYLASCVSRNVLSYMESREITDCFLPKYLFRDASKIIELEKRNAG